MSEEPRCLSVTQKELDLIQTIQDLTEKIKILEKKVNELDGED